MSELGTSLRQLRTRGEYKAKTLESPEKPIGIKTPLERGTSKKETLFKMHYNIIDQLEDNLKNLVMTQKGERLGFPDYGTRLREIYSNNTLDENEIADLASNEIQNVVQKFMPSIRLVEFYSNRISNNNKKENAANEKGLELSNALSQNVSVQDVDVFESNKNIQDIESFYEIIVKYSIPLLNKSRSLKLIINSSK
tara:strand:- start:1263 stop:1850 length:588 start_codon:yes stop_codon:yes gene_type:complete